MRRKTNPAAVKSCLLDLPFLSVYMGDQAAYATNLDVVAGFFAAGKGERGVRQRIMCVCVRARALSMGADWLKAASTSQKQSRKQNTQTFVRRVQHKPKQQFDAQRHTEWAVCYLDKGG